MSNEFDDYIHRILQGRVETAREFSCPVCGGIAHLEIGTLTTRPANWLWMSAWCEDCGEEHKYDGVEPWLGYECLLQTDDHYYSQSENLERIKRFLLKERLIQALRLYRQISGVDLKQAQDAIQELKSDL